MLSVIRTTPRWSVGISQPVDIYRRRASDSLLIYVMSRLSRKQVQQPAPLYAAVPQSPSRVNPQTGQPQPYIGGPRPVQSSSSSSNNHRSKQQNERSTIAMGVATGNIGAGYGPYSVRYFFLIIQICNLTDLRLVSSTTSSRSCRPYEFSI